VNYAEFSPDGRRGITTSDDETTRIVEVPLLPPAVPPWLADVAEAVAGQRLDARNASQPVPFAELHRLRQNLARDSEGDEAARWAMWFFAESATRRISPGATLTVPQLVQQRIQDNTVESLQQALALSPNNGVALARLASATLTNTPTPDPHLLAVLEWQSRHGVELSPMNPDAWRARSKFLDHLGKTAEAAEVMDRATSSPGRTACCCSSPSRWSLEGHPNLAPEQSFSTKLPYKGNYNHRWTRISTDTQQVGFKSGFIEEVNPRLAVSNRGFLRFHFPLKGYSSSHFYYPVRTAWRRRSGRTFAKYECGRHSTEN
jgi:hypothetical protein